MSEQSKHTPGPWKVEGPRVYQDKPKGGRLICTLAYGAEEQCDARLIAASTEMLEILKAIVANDFEMTVGARLVIREVIAKAEG